MVHDRVGQTVERHNGVENAEFGAGTRHSVDRAGGLVLADRVPATIVDCFHPAGAVIAHAGHDHAEGCRAECLGRGEHGDINGGAVQGVTRFFRKLNECFVSRVKGQHMPPSRGDEGHAWFDGIVVAGFANVDFAKCVQALGEGPSESRRHMLHDENSAREGSGKRGKELLEGFRAAGGGADTNNLWFAFVNAAWN